MTTRKKLLLAIAAILLLGAGLLEGELAMLVANQRPDAEAARLAQALQIDHDDAVAEIGAGAGRLTVAIARLVPDGRVYSTELSQDRLADIRAAVAAAQLRNVEVREAAIEHTNLPAGCCDAMFMRTVYHHFTSPPAMIPALHQALRPGARLAIIDFDPRGIWRWFAVPHEVPERGGHGVPRDMLVREVTTSGRFVHVRTIDRWAGRLYLALFTRT